MILLSHEEKNSRTTMRDYHFILFHGSLVLTFFTRHAGRKVECTDRKYSVAKIINQSDAAFELVTKCDCRILYIAARYIARSTGVSTSFIYTIPHKSLSVEILFNIQYFAIQSVRASRIFSKLYISCLKRD